jgi:hypothetical protein
VYVFFAFHKGIARFGGFILDYGANNLLRGFQIPGPCWMDMCDALRCVRDIYNQLTTQHDPHAQT